MGRTRIDIYLVEKGLFPSRTKAQDAIAAGLVTIKTLESFRQVTLASEIVDDMNPPEILLQKSSVDRYVSRAGAKLEGALNALALSVEGANVLDVGMSTGGFTDCLLQRGAKAVIGVDVGRNQLSYKLKVDPRVRFFEGVNARDLNLYDPLKSAMPVGGFDLIVADVSFISLSLILPGIWPLLKTGGTGLVLIKPQFEVGPDNIDRGGIVKDRNQHIEAQKKIEKSLRELSARDIRIFDSPIEGKDGNKEFFGFFKK